MLGTQVSKVAIYLEGKSLLKPFNTYFVYKAVYFTLHLHVMKLHNRKQKK